VTEQPERRAADQQEVLAAAVGMALWAIALVVLAVFFRDHLQRHDATWWLWACGLGLVLGLYGLRFALRRRRG
jgi:membrane protein DedA with SNARE-associated domain